MSVDTKKVTTQYTPKQKITNSLSGITKIRPEATIPAPTPKTTKTSSK